MTVRIKDIAREANVSPTTVSNVIHGNTKKVSPATLERIEAILNKRQYIPSMGARMLAGNSSHLIGVLIGSKRRQEHGIDRDPFTSILLETLETEIFRQGYYMLFHISDRPEENWALAATWNIEGLITIGLSPEENEGIREKCGIPLVTVDVYYDIPGMANIGLKDEEGGYLMAQFLFDHGHTDFLFLADNDTGVDHMRWEGIVTFLKEQGSSEGALRERHLLIPSDIAGRQAYYQKKLPLFLEKQALFFASDYYAAEAVQYLRQNNIRIPEQISIAGFDDNVYASMCSPPLTTIRQNVPQKAAAAVRKLAALIRGETGIQLEERFPVELIIRDSVALRR